MSDTKHITDQQRMWQVMRILKRFDVQILRYTTTANKASGTMIAYNTAETYCRILARAGYLNKLSKDNFMITDKAKGGLAPMITRDKKLLDPNSEELITIYRGAIRGKNIRQIMSLIEGGKEFRIADIQHKIPLKFRAIKDAIKPLVRRGEIKKIRKEKQGKVIVGVYVYVGKKGEVEPLFHNNSNEALTNSK